MPITCPHCTQEFSLEMTASIPDQQEFSIAIKFEGTFLVAETLSKLVGNTAQLLKAIAKEHEEKVTIFIKGIEYLPHETSASAKITFMIAKNKKKNSHE